LLQLLVKIVANGRVVRFKSRNHVLSRCALGVEYICVARKFNVPASMLAFPGTTGRPPRHGRKPLIGIANGQYKLCFGVAYCQGPVESLRLIAPGRVLKVLLPGCKLQCEGCVVPISNAVYRLSSNSSRPGILPSLVLFDMFIHII
jgi:hypothetical protein